MMKYWMIKTIRVLFITLCLSMEFLFSSGSQLQKEALDSLSVETVSKLNQVETKLKIFRIIQGQVLSETALSKFPQLNVADFLKGTVAGIQVKNSSSGAGGSVSISLRGQHSVSENTGPLFVVDGIPLVNNRGDQPNMWGGWDEGDGLSQINPDDIAEIEVVKGASGVILYGSQAANGVVFITTKKAKQSHLRVTLNSSTLFEKVISTPELQFRYGSSYDGATESWATTAGDYPDNYVSDFFSTGLTATNSLSISGGGKYSTVYANFSNTSAKGVVENNQYRRNNFALRNVSRLFGDRLKLQAGVSYADEMVENRYATGYYLNPLTGLYLFQRNGGVPMNNYSLGNQPFSYFKENYSIPDSYTGAEEQNWFVSDHLQSNPYWLLNKQPQEDQTQRLLANISVVLNIVKNLDIKLLSGYDYADKSYEQQYYAGGNPVNIGTNGRWRYKKYKDKNIYLDGSFSYLHRFNQATLRAMLGANYRKSDYFNGYQIDSSTLGLNSPNVFTEDNLPAAVSQENLYSYELTRKGVYASVNFDYKSSIDLDLAVRNDMTSSLISENNEGHWYTAAKLSGKLNEWFTLPAVVNRSQIYVSTTSAYRELSSSLMEQYRNSGLSSFSSVAPTDDMKAEKISSWEVGTSWAFGENRLSADFVYYQSTNANEALLRANSGTGLSAYAYSFVNLGDIVNKGLEISLAVVPVKTASFSWQSIFNFSKNKNEVKDLASTSESAFVDFGSSEGYYARTYAGGAVGDLYGYKFVRNEDGKLVLDESSGTPKKTSAPEYLGNLNPDFCLGWSNSLNYRNFSIDLQINANIGGKAFSQTESMLDGYGVSRRTADARDKGYVTVDAIQGETLINQLDPVSYYTTVGGRNGIGENYVYDRTNIRLAQAALAYHFNVESLGLPLQAASVSLVGNNLFFLYKKAPFDPELAMSTGLDSQSVDNFSVPATRMFGFNLKVSF